MHKLSEVAGRDPNPDDKVSKIWGLDRPSQGQGGCWSWDRLGHHHYSCTWFPGPRWAVCHDASSVQVCPHVDKDEKEWPKLRPPSLEGPEIGVASSASPSWLVPANC